MQELSKKEEDSKKINKISVQNSKQNSNRPVVVEPNNFPSRPQIKANVDEMDNEVKSNVVEYRILHQETFKVEKVLTQSSQANIFIGRLKMTSHIQEKDLPYVADKLVVIK